MEKPQPGPGLVPDSQPPPYSDVVGSRSQAYTPVPPPPTNSPFPKQIPTSQDTTVYDPMSQATTDDGQPLPRPDLNSTIYDPMANLPPVNSESASNQTLIVSAQSADSAPRTKRCRYMKVCSGIGGVLLILGFVARVLRSMSDNERYEDLRVDHIYARDIQD